MIVQSKGENAQGFFVLCELTAREVSILTGVPADRVPDVPLGSEVAIDPQSRLAQNSLAMSKRIALVALEDAVALAPELAGDVTALREKLEAHGPIGVAEAPSRP